MPSQPARTASSRLPVRYLLQDKHLLRYRYRLKFCSSEMRRRGMSEPQAVAETVDEVVPVVWRWLVVDERIDSERNAHTISNHGGTMLIDCRLGSRRST